MPMVRRTDAMYRSQNRLRNASFASPAAIRISGTADRMRSIANVGNDLRAPGGGLV